MNKVGKGRQGFTIVELLVSLAIIGMIILAICSFMMTGSKVYDRSDKEVDIQQESQITVNLINDMLLGASNIKYKSMNSGMPDEIHLVCYETIDDTDAQVTEALIWFKEKKAIYIVTRDGSFVYDGSDSQMLDLCAAVNENTDLLGSNVTNMEVDTSNVRRKQVVEVSIDFERSGASFKNSKVIKLRNKQE